MLTIAVNALKKCGKKFFSDTFFRRKTIFVYLSIPLAATILFQPKNSYAQNSVAAVELSAVLFSPTHPTQFRDSYGFFGGFYRISEGKSLRYRLGLEGGFSSGLLTSQSVDYGYTMLQLSLHAGLEVLVLKGPYGSPFLFAEALGGRTGLTLDITLDGEDRIDLWTYGYRAGVGFQFGPKRRSVRFMGFIRGEPTTVGGQKLDIGGMGGTLAFTF
jgi:hypothetical protein